MKLGPNWAAHEPRRRGSARSPNCSRAVRGTEWYHEVMATNLRLRDETELALRKESERSGRSQQDLIREALDRFLGLSDPRDESTESLISRGLLVRPSHPLRHSDRLLELPPGVTSLDLLDREDRF